MRRLRCGNLSEKTCLMFPGQGTQRAGMGRELMKSSVAARRVFEEADEALGWKLSSFMAETGTEEEITQTENAQPAILVHSLATLAAVAENLEVEPQAIGDFAMGHSLGEFTALAACGCMSLQDAVRVVRARGEAMQRAAESIGEPTSMMALMRADFHVIEEACKSVEGVAIANWNTRDQVTISGTATAVSRLAQLAKKELGVRRATPLKVSAPFHSPYMAPAREALSEALSNASTLQGPPSRQLIMNLSGSLLELDDDDGSWRQTLQYYATEQLTSTVRWNQSLESAVASGVRNFIDLGPGTVLAAMAPRSHTVYRVSLDSGVAEFILK
eukprot:g310.t1